MADPRYTVQVALHRDMGLPEDDIVNTMHFEGDDDVDADDEERWAELRPGLVSRVIAFYVSISSTFSSILSGNATVKVYNPADPSLPGAPRVPRWTETFVISPASGVSLPAEVALCVSFRGAAESGVNMRRRRGRIFLGPIAASAITSGTAPNNDARPTAALRAGILANFDAMATGTSGAARLAVYSPTADPLGTGVEGSWTDVTTAWIDDAWDTIRKRGATPSSREIVAIT